MLLGFFAPVQQFLALPDGVMDAVIFVESCEAEGATECDHVAFVLNVAVAAASCGRFATNHIGFFVGIKNGWICHRVES